MFQQTTSKLATPITRPELLAALLVRADAGFPAGVYWPGVFQLGEAFPSAPGWQIRYNAAGSMVSGTDAAGHQNQVSYTDSFSDGNNGRNTFAYPTMIKDADWNASTAPNNYSTVQYNFDFGAAGLRTAFFT